MSGLWIFEDCESTESGGGCYIEANTTNSNYDVNLLGKMQFSRCKVEDYGGGMCIYSENAGQITINEMSFTDCNSTWSGGGGFYSSLRSGTKMTITGKVTFDNCRVEGGTGGYGGG